MPVLVPTNRNHPHRLVEAFGDELAPFVRQAGGSVLALAPHHPIAIDGVLNDQSYWVSQLEQAGYGVAFPD